jgi:pimeloyl-ACP methyl ester carboxylesterase
MPLTEVNGVRLLVEQSGEGDPLVLVHGSWENRLTWGQVEESLGRRFRVITYDRRGHSGSEDGPEPGTRRDDEEDLAALIESLGLGPVNVLANSFGGSISLGLLCRRPELFKSLSAHEPPLFSLAVDDPEVARVAEGAGFVLEQIASGDSEGAARSFVENVALGPGAWAILPEKDRETMIENAGTFADEMRDPEMGNMDLTALGDVRVPVLLTQGDQSPPFFARIIGRLDEAIDGAEVATVAGAGHVPQATHPDDYVALINRFLDGRDR